MSPVEKPAGTVPETNCGAQVWLSPREGWATCTDHGLGHVDLEKGLSWPAGEGRLMTEADR